MLASGNANVIRVQIDNLAIGAIGALATLEVAVAIPGAAAGDGLVVVPNAAINSGVSIAYCRITGANAGVVAFTNCTAAPIDPADTIDFTFHIIKATGTV